MLNEYPRPHFYRPLDLWQSLNGEWTMAIESANYFDTARYQEIKDILINSQELILVPYSMETKLNHEKHHLLPTETLLMSTRFDVNFIPDEMTELHFGAVDQQCHVWLNDVYLGHHGDGYLPFSFDISACLKQTDNQLIMVIKDESNEGDYPWGKQVLNPKTIWYTAQSGIWQTVWLESHPSNHLTSFYTEPMEDGIKVFFSSYQASIIEMIIYEPTLNGQNNVDFLLDNYRCLQKHVIQSKAEIKLDLIKKWSPQEPWLYPVELRLGNDVVKTYFGLRSCGLKQNQQGVLKTTLNNEEIFQSGVLDQGYYQNGLYTPDSDEMMINDIVLMKQMGFNTLRKHIKIEPSRWYYHCDRLGMMVHQDMVNGGTHYNNFMTQYLPFINIHINDKHHSLFGRQCAKGRKLSIEHQKHVINHLRSHCSVVMWVLSNEGWGQFDTLMLTQMARRQDSTRWIDHASGWHDQGGGDFKSPHVYYKPIRLKHDQRALYLSEFGGYSYGVQHHSSNNPFGYRQYSSQEAYNQAVINLYTNEVLIYRDILSGCIYTQLSDVEDEINGLVTFDREVVKWDISVLNKLNKKLIEGE